MLPEIAKPLNPTASTRKEIATPLVWEKPTTRSRVASMPKPATETEEPSWVCQSAELLTERVNLTQISWVFSAYIPAQYLRYSPVFMIVWPCHCLGVLWTFYLILVNPEQQMVPVGSMIVPGWEMWVVNPWRLLMLVWRLYIQPVTPFVYVSYGFLHRNNMTTLL